MVSKHVCVPGHISCGSWGGSCKQKGGGQRGEDLKILGWILVLSLHSATGDRRQPTAKPPHLKIQMCSLQICHENQMIVSDLQQFDYMLHFCDGAKQYTLSRNWTLNLIFPPLRIVTCRIVYCAAGQWSEPQLSLKHESELMLCTVLHC